MRWNACGVPSSSSSEIALAAGSGGAIGVGGGVLMATLVGALIQHAKPMWVNVVSHPAVVTALIVSVSVGLVFGYFPARRAGRLDAITAIRS